MFICNHCPYVQHIDAGLVQLGNDYKDSEIAIIAISSNDVASHPQDGPEEMAKKAKILGYNFPYLYDESQETARAYRAACTPVYFYLMKASPVFIEVSLTTPDPATAYQSPEKTYEKL